MRSLISAISLLFFAVAFARPVFAADTEAQKSAQGGVTVVVTPQSLSRDAASWNFTVVFDTHSQDLNDDLTKAAVLLDGAGGRYAPIGWEGPGPGGHHREGVLRFKAISPRPQSIELQIMRAGESGTRSFRWQLK